MPQGIPAVLAVLASSAAQAQSPDPASGIDQRIAAAVAPFADAVSTLVFSTVRIASYDLPLILLWLLAAAIFCTLYFGFINVRGFAHGFRIIRGDYADRSSVGETSHFQALATALSGTVGLGNIAGVAVAIALGGPGATFWMIVAGVLGMASKFCECTLGVLYRRENPDGSISGGPMYYLSRGIAARYPKLAPLGKLLAVMFAIFCIGGAIGAGNLFQVNSTYQQLKLITGGETGWLAGYAWLFGLVMATLVGIVVIGGMRSIARVTDKLVPFMAAFYMIAGCIVIGANVEHVPAAFAAIWNGAFSPQGITGGIVGVMLVGFRRAVFSNEAGVGTAAIAHSTVRTRHAVTEGFVALWEPFIDTVVICTMTALVIVISQATTVAPDATGVELTSIAFGTVMPWFPYALGVAVFLFAYATMIAYAYYGTKAATYLFGESRAVDLGFKLVFCASTVIGCTMNFDRLVDFSDAVFFLMAIPNVIGIYLLAPVVKEELARYRAGLASGEIRPQRDYLDKPVPSL